MNVIAIHNGNCSEFTTLKKKPEVHNDNKRGDNIAPCGTPPANEITLEDVLPYEQLMCNKRLHKRKGGVVQSNKTQYYYYYYYLFNVANLFHKYTYSIFYYYDYIWNDFK